MILVIVVSFYAEFNAIKFCSVFMCLILLFCKNTFSLSEIFSLSKCSGFVPGKEEEHQRENYNFLLSR